MAGGELGSPRAANPLGLPQSAGRWVRFPDRSFYCSAEAEAVIGTPSHPRTRLSVLLVLPAPLPGICERDCRLHLIIGCAIDLGIGIDEVVERISALWRS